MQSRQKNIPVTIVLSVEYYLDDGFIHKLEERKIVDHWQQQPPCFLKSAINAPDNLLQVIFRMQVLGYKPIMAHPERYPFWGNNFDFLRQSARAKCFVAR